MENYYFDEEKRAARGSWKNFLIPVAIVSAFLSVFAGFLIFKYVTYQSLSPLQRYYFSEFLKSSFKNQFAFSKQGHYKILMYRAADPKTKKVDWYGCAEEQLFAETDENGNVLFDQNKNPRFLIKNNVTYEKNSYSFYPNKIEHQWAYNFFSERIYQSSVKEVFYLSSAGFGASFFFLVFGAMILRKKYLSRILEGKYIRGTQLLSAEKYAKDMRRNANGIGIEVLPAE